MTIQKVHIKNFKSIVDLSLDLGLVNVFIGENGSGKSNVLEAIAFAGAAAADKLDNEFLPSRGIRVTEPRFMRSSFEHDDEAPVCVDILYGTTVEIGFKVTTSGGGPYPRWIVKPLIKSASPLDKNQQAESENTDKFTQALNTVEQFVKVVERESKENPHKITKDTINQMEEIGGLLAELFLKTSKEHSDPLTRFIIYSPEVSALRVFEKEGQILPLGVRGEGLLKLLRVLAAEEPESWQALQKSLGLLDWLAGIDLSNDDTLPERSIRVRDRFVSDSLPAFDQRSANEGFLYLLFFFALMLSKETPQFFAIENIDTSLNPKACSELMRRLATLAVERQKQILFTTHNPSLLDGLNLHDDAQRLFVVSRNRDGHTKARRILPPKPVGDELPIRLSEAFTRGLLGGIPKNF